MENDLISIIIPTFNRAYCIRETLNSVLAQTHTHWEALVVDDGSSDGTRALIVKEYGGDPRIRYLHHENGGVSRARNTGIAASRGAYVAFMDSDDTWQPWKLAVQLRCLQTYPELGMVWTDMAAVDPAGTIVDARHLQTMYSAYRFFDKNSGFDQSVRLGDVAPDAEDSDARVYMGDIYSDMIMGNLVHTSTVMLRRERLEKVKKFDESLKLSGEDYDFHLRTCRWGRVGLIDVASTFYRKGSDDQLSRDTYSIAINFLTTVERAIEGDLEERRFPPHRSRRVLADAHGWVAEESFKRREHGAVRRHALASLRRRGSQPRLILLSALSCVPGFLSEAILSTYRRLRKSRQM